MNRFSKMLRASALFGILVSGAVSTPSDASEGCYTGYSSYCDGWYFGAEALFWKPMVTEFDYANEVTYDQVEFLLFSANNVKSHYLCPKRDVGVRYALGKENFWCGWNLGGTYTNYKSHKSNSLSAEAGEDFTSLFKTNLIGLGVLVIQDPFDFTFVGTPAFFEVEAKYKLDYKDFDVLLSHDYCLNECHSFRPFFGVEGMKIKQSFKGVYDGFILPPIVGLFEEEVVPFSPTVDWDSEYKGLGLKLGTGYDYKFNDCLSLVTNFSGSLLAGKVKNKNSQFTQDEEVEDEDFIAFTSPIKYDANQGCVFVPGARMDLGLVYHKNWCGWDFELSLGYEFLVWYNLPKIHRFETSVVELGGDFIEESGGEILNTSINELTGGTLGVHGFNVGFSVSF